MSKKRMIGRFLGTTVLSGALAGAVALPAFAQDDDRIVVTGTRVQNANLVSSSPVTQVNAEEFTLTGTTRVEDLLNTYPQLAPSFDSFTVNPTTGFATADLRGLGTARTLVLVNGHRMQPGGIRSEARDLNQIPAALVERIEVLTGGASAVYGSDAMAGVVNFILDNNFEGFNVRTGVSGYQHKNRNDYIQGLMDARGFDYPTGGTGIDGKAYNVDVAAGSAFADGRGHGMAYFTYRQNKELRQESRDYSSCALSGAGTSCGGSSTAPDPNFQFFDEAGTIGGFTNYHEGTWSHGTRDIYNFAPINHYQRPDERWTFGSAVSYDVNQYFRPYVETMFSNTNTSVQIAESGTFFVNGFALSCDSPLLGSACADLGIPLTYEVLDDDDNVVGVEDNIVYAYAGKRNVEGGPRIANIESSSFRVVTGFTGDLNENWNYDVSFLYGRNASSESNANDFIPSLIEEAVLNCLDPDLLGTAACYDVFRDNVTAEAAAGLGGIGMRQGATSMLVAGGYLTGNTGITSPWANDSIAIVLGTEFRKETYEVRSDTNMATGNFAGLGGPRPPIDGEISVHEFYTEAGVPIIEDAGLLRSFSLDLGYRFSDYSTSGGVHSYKAGASAAFGEWLRFRGGYNRAIRAPNTNELFAQQQIALFGGADPCAGATPEFTLAQCALTGVSAAQYGSISANPAAQNNQFIGGNPDLQPEIADTYTVGFVATPISGLQASVDFYDISIKDRIGTIGALTVLRFCGLTGDPDLCAAVNRHPSRGDIWVGSDPATSGYVTNLNANFGTLHFRGLDFTGSYAMDLGAGRLTSSFVGSLYLKQEIAPLAGVNDDATYDCAGVVNPTCTEMQPDWRHTMRVSYNWDWLTGSVRWRYTGSKAYINTDGTPGTTDLLLVGNGGKIPSMNYIDLTAGFDVHENATLTVGVNNLMDKEPPMVGADIALNANAPGGYDQLGRYLFATLDLRF